MMPTRLSAACFVAALLPAQDPIPTRAFLPDDHRHVMFADMKALRERGIWDDLEASVLKLFFAQIEKEAAVKLRELDRVTMGAETPVQREGGGMDVRQVAVIESSTELALPESVTRGSWNKDAVNGHEIWRHARNDEVVARPRPEVRVVGSAALVEPVLEGKPHTGLPCADVMSLLSGRGDNLAYLAVDVDNPVLRDAFLKRLFPDATWPEGDGPKFLLLRLRAIGEADDPHLEVEAVVRHTKAGDGLAATGKAVDAVLETMQKDPALRGLKPMWSKLQRATDRGDLVLRVDLGRSRDAVGTLALLMTPIFKPHTVESSVEVQVQPQPQPQAQPKPKKDG
jgi:hypothetical protein